MPQDMLLKTYYNNLQYINMIIRQLTITMLIFKAIHIPWKGIYNLNKQSRKRGLKKKKMCMFLPKKVF